MSKNKITINAGTDDCPIEFIILGDNRNVPVIIEDAAEHGESPIQISEGCFYEYQISDGYSLEQSNIVLPSEINASIGRIAPNIYVGTLSINIIRSNTKEKAAELRLEVRSVKTSYREDYRAMLEEITEKCTDLLLEHNSPVSQFFETDFNVDSNTLYQRFAFIRSILESPEFDDSVRKTLSSPVTRWKSTETTRDIRSVRRVNAKIYRQIAGASCRVDLPTDHPLKETIQSVPAKLNVSFKTETVDTPENKFVKYVLITFHSFCSDIKNKINPNERVNLEITSLEDKLEQYISHSILREVSSLTTIPLNNPVLQRKEGYREILRVWLMFDLAAKLVWRGGDDVYSGNKRDVAILYEYWLFFKLLDIIKEIFKISPLATHDLIEKTEKGLGLRLKQGKFFPIRGTYKSGNRNFEIQFSYNKTFSGKNQYPKAGSWTRTLRPDYTLSIWPSGISEEQAETEELIVHIHFDAKYKIDNLQAIFGEDESSEEEERTMGTYKRTDLLKMHSYRDAIRRTAGAYILYPGTTHETLLGFHELLPGLGAFPIRPSKIDDGTAELKMFLLDVAEHFKNRASQREKMSLQTYEIYRTSETSQVRESLPETYGKNRRLLPDDTQVLVGFYKNQEHLDWIEKHHLYNARTGEGNGTLRLNPENIGAKYLLLHTHGELETNRLFKLKSAGPRLFSKKDLGKLYPNATRDFYLVFDIEDDAEFEFKKYYWDIRKLKGYSSDRQSALPFSVSLTELMKAVVI